MRESALNQPRSRPNSNYGKGPGNEVGIKQVLIRHIFDAEYTPEIVTDMNVYKVGVKFKIIIGYI